jgi:hypothetical protein
MADLTARNRSNKRKGAKWEVDLVNGFREVGFTCERLTKTGSEDEGDLHLSASWVPSRSVIVVEAKNTGNPSWSSYVDEAAKEARNYEAHRALQQGRALGVAIVRRRGKTWKDAYVVTTVREYFGLED